MPLARRENGYPVSARDAQNALVEASAPSKADAPRVVKATDGIAQPSAKDRSIIRQTAWKIAGPAMVNWTGSPEAWFEKCVELRGKIEKDMLGAND